MSNDGLTINRWEPSSAAGSTWATSWLEIGGDSYAAPWNGSSWGPASRLGALNGSGTNDVYLSWDSVRSRFVFVALDNLSTHNVWYGFSNDSTGSSWTTSTLVFSGGTNWDFPSVGVDASGRVIVGAVAFPGPSGFFAAVSSDGVNFSAPSRIGSAPGAQSRVIATDNVFHAFVPTLDGSNLPIAIDRYQSSDGVNWSGPFNIATFGAPLNNSPGTYCGASGCGSIFYAPLLEAKGYTNGLWSVVFQINNGGFNNVYICTADRGCGIINGAADDQFLTGTSVSGDSGYWVSYDAYSTLSTRQLPLITQAIYFPPGAAAIGATTNSGIDPTSWLLTGARCLGSCFASGDYQGISSNPFAAASTPFVQQSPRANDLFQSFVQDPPGTPNVVNFKPNFIPFPLGANLRARAQAVPAQAVGLLPSLKIGPPKKP